MADSQPYASLRQILRYAKSRFKTYKRDEAYRFYLSEILRTIAENTAKMGGGTTINMNYSEFLERAFKPADNRTGDEIAEEVMRNAGITLE